MAAAAEAAMSRHEFSAVIHDAGGGGAYVEIPFDVEQVFGRKRVPVKRNPALGTNTTARAYFEGLSFTHQREYVDWITSAKRDATRVSRIEKAVTLLEQKRKTR
jgi:hypothetical protein